MKIKQAREYFELGILTRFVAVPDPMKVGSWLLEITGKDGRKWTIETALGPVKSYSSLDTLLGEIESITRRVSAIHFSI